MLAITRGDKLYEQFEPWSALEQSLVRFNEHVQELCHRKGTFHYYLGLPDDWMNDHVTIPLGLYDRLNYMCDIVFTLTALIMNNLVQPLYHFTKQRVLDYWGIQTLEISSWRSILHSVFVCKDDNFSFCRSQQVYG
jgi:hypothetical protein